MAKAGEIPKYVNHGDDKGNLPPGQWVTTWPEFYARYRWTEHRRDLLKGLRAVLDNLKAAGCKKVYIDGSFVTSKENPGDFDGCWDHEGINEDLLHPCLFDLKTPRLWQKREFKGEMFPAEFPADRFGSTYLDYFQRDRYTGRPKGIIVINL